MGTDRCWFLFVVCDLFLFVLSRSAGAPKGIKFRSSCWPLTCKPDAAARGRELCAHECNITTLISEHSPDFLRGWWRGHASRAILSHVEIYLGPSRTHSWAMLCVIGDHLGLSWADIGPVLGTSWTIVPRISNFKGVRRSSRQHFLHIYI